MWHVSNFSTCLRVPALLLGRPTRYVSYESYASDAPRDTPLEAIAESAPKGNKTSKRRRKTMDDVLGDVLNEAIEAKGEGTKPDMEFIYKKTQEKIYENEHGRKPSSAKTEDFQKKYLPFPPNMSLYRLEPDACLDPAQDPWPARAITPSNPVLTRFEAAKEQREAQGSSSAEESSMYAPRSDVGAAVDFADAIDEHHHWFIALIRFIRDVPLWQRRSLPYLHEHYRRLVHRLVRAELRFTACRDRALADIKASPAVFAQTEERIEVSRSLCAETLRSLSSANYDPAKQRKLPLSGSIMKMDGAAFDAWLHAEQHRINALVAQIV